MLDRETIIRLAREAGFPIPNVPAHELEPALLTVVERFAALVAAAEREACAGVCDIALSLTDGPTATIVHNCAAAIRARGTT